MDLTWEQRKNLQIVVEEVDNIRTMAEGGALTGRGMPAGARRDRDKGERKGKKKTGGEGSCYPAGKGKRQKNWGHTLPACKERKNKGGANVLKAIRER